MSSHAIDMDSVEISTFLCYSHQKNINKRTRFRCIEWMFQNLFSLIVPIKRYPTILVSKRCFFSSYSQCHTQCRLIDKIEWFCSDVRFWCKNKFLLHKTDSGHRKIISRIIKRVISVEKLENLLKLLNKNLIVNALLPQ